MLGIYEFTPAEQEAGVAVKARSHGIALPGDGIGSCSGPANVPGHQREVDNCLRCASAFVALIDAHCPPEAHALTCGNGVDEFVEYVRAQSCGGADDLGSK